MQVNQRPVDESFVAADTAANFHAIGDMVKAVASYVATRAWMISCLRHYPNDGQHLTTLHPLLTAAVRLTLCFDVADRCRDLLITANTGAAVLTHIMEPEPACCFAEEALHYSHPNTPVRGAVVFLISSHSDTLTH